MEKNGYKKKKDFMAYFCGEMNIQPSTVRDWQRGDHAPSKKEVIKQIGEKLNISDWKLLLTEEDRKQSRLEIIVVTNMIGGVGKTCVAQAIATILGHKKGNTLLVDGDSLRWMSNLTSDEYINLEKEKISSSKYMDILTLPRNLYSMYSFEAPEKRNLKSYLEKLSVENGYKYVVVDVNPGEYQAFEEALYAANIIIAPTGNGFFDLKNTSNFLSFLSKRRLVNKCYLLAVQRFKPLKDEISLIKQCEKLCNKANAKIYQTIIPYSKSEIYDIVADKPKSKITISFGNLVGQLPTVQGPVGL